MTEADVEASAAAGPPGSGAQAEGRGAATLECGSPLQQGSQLRAASLQCRMIDGEAVLDVAPLAGRLVLMLSGAVDHAVLPSQQQRVALTAWCQ